MLALLGALLLSAEDAPLGERLLQSFEPRLQAAVRSNDPRRVVALIEFPLRVNALRPRRVRYFRTRAAVLRDYARIFTPEIRAAMRDGPYAGMASHGAMIGSGAVWLGPHCPGKVCDEAAPLRITTINQGS